jgi:transcriptional regulator with XRE-family HTH domain
MNQPPSLYEFVMARLLARPATQRQIAQGSGVPFSTVTKIAQGAVKDPGVHTVQRLADYFHSLDQADPKPAVSSHHQQAA